MTATSCMRNTTRSHAASAFYPSPFAEAAILTMDGVGRKWSYDFDGYRSRKGGSSCHENCSGLTRSACSIRHSPLLHGLQSQFGRIQGHGPRSVRTPDVRADDLRSPDRPERGWIAFRINQEYFDYLSGLTMTNGRFHTLFGAPPRTPETDLTQREMGLGALRPGRVRGSRDTDGPDAAQRDTHLDNLCLAGGVALNCVANGKLLRQGPFKQLWIQARSRRCGRGPRRRAADLAPSPRQSPDDYRQGSDERVLSRARFH